MKPKSLLLMMVEQGGREPKARGVLSPQRADAEPVEGHVHDFGLDQVAPEVVATDRGADVVARRAGLGVDLCELLDHGVDVLILSRGIDWDLPETFTWLDDRGIAYEHLQSEEAARRYNQLRAEARRVGLLLHSTC